CAIADGEVYCWGSNWSGQLGDGTNDDSNVPVAVSTDGVLAGKTVTSISAGQSQTCAIADGKAYCWGENWNGELGNGTNDHSSVPMAVVADGALADKTVTAISSSPGGWHTCAIADGAVYCWGAGESGELGNGSNITYDVPVAVSPLPLI
ncbi:MAG TPA: RCC1 repeat-containing protein, partial [Candidatus Saccharibacteria bacterium]|nr:RCC1 repeat-containing protein [Candidatus Saccharibacteria bacterium]